jgi:hypothetical protein
VDDDLARHLPRGLVPIPRAAQICKLPLCIQLHRSISRFSQNLSCSDFPIIIVQNFDFDF